AVAAVAAFPVLAAAPQPARPISPAFYSGLWYEIARTPNLGQRDCQAAHSRFTPLGGEGEVSFIASTGEFSVSQTCHKGSPSGPGKVFRTKGRIVPGSANAKFEMSFFGGLRKQEYWVLDRAEDQTWVIMATPGGNYAWLMARRPRLPTAVKAAALSRMNALGYPADSLEFPRSAG
ncbi:MAG: lipocalin family protein, partial [Reyranella sp.]|nr:lipocalin family protein [Reyranella sp.]